MPFLDTLVKPEHNGKLNTRGFRKPTYTDQYLPWDSHYDTVAKCSVLSTIKHRAKTVYSTSEHLTAEVEHIKEVLTKCKYPAWAVEWMECKTFHQGRPYNDSNNNNNKSKGYIVIQYVQGLCESKKNICGKYGINAYFKGNRTIKKILLSQKDKN